MNALACPRCHGPIAGDAPYGPCPDCRTQLRANAERRHVGWLVVMFLAGRLTASKPRIGGQDRPGAPADPSDDAQEPTTPSRLEETTVFPDHGSRQGRAS